MSDVTSILSRIEAGDPRAAEQLLPLVYDELRRLVGAAALPARHQARARLKRHKSSGTFLADFLAASALPAPRYRL